MKRNSILTNPAQKKVEESYGIKRVFETIMIYGGPDWKDPLGQTKNDVGVNDQWVEVIVMTQDNILPTISERSNVRNKLTYFYTLKTIQDIILPNTKKPQKPNYIVGRPFFTQPTKTSLELNYENMKYRRDLYAAENTQNPEQIRDLDNQIDRMIIELSKALKPSVQEQGMNPPPSAPPFVAPPTSSSFENIKKRREARKAMDALEQERREARKAMEALEQERRLKEREKQAGMKPSFPPSMPPGQGVEKVRVGPIIPPQGPPMPIPEANLRSIANFQQKRQVAILDVEQKKEEERIAVAEARKAATEEMRRLKQKEQSVQSTMKEIRPPAFSGLFGKKTVKEPEANIDPEENARKREQVQFKIQTARAATERRILAEQALQKIIEKGEMFLQSEKQKMVNEQKRLGQEQSLLGKPKGRKTRRRRGSARKTRRA